MKKATPIHYSTAVTFLRGNIGHHGHVQLIQTMLTYASQAHVYVSTGKSNNDWDLRVLLLRTLCRDANVDLGRVEFRKSASPFDALEQSTDESLYKEVVFVVGSDQQQLALTLSEVYDCPYILNRRTTSSTEMRFFLDEENFIEDLTHLYEGNRFAITLAKLLRKEESDRESTLVA